MNGKKFIKGRKSPLGNQLLEWLMHGFKQLRKDFHPQFDFLRNYCNQQAIFKVLVSLPKDTKEQRMDIKLSSDCWKTPNY